MAGSTMSSPGQSVPKFAYVGSYTTKERKGNGEGINVYQVDAATGNWTHVQLLKDVNPSFLTFDRQKRTLYSAHGDGGEATAYRIDAATGRLTLLHKQATNGKNGVSHAVDATNRFLVLANYSSGTVTVLPINPDGSLAPLSDLYALQGKPGPHRAEQASSHPHDVVFDPRLRFIVVEGIGRCQEAELVGFPDHVHFEAEAHAGLFEVLAEGSVDQADGGEILHAAEAGSLYFTQKRLHDAKGIGAADAGEDRRVLDHGKNFAGHVHDDLIGVAVGHHAGHAAAARHAEPAGAIAGRTASNASLLVLRLYRHTRQRTSRLVLDLTVEGADLRRLRSQGPGK